MVSDMTLSRSKESLPGVAYELRPALADGDPAAALSDGLPLTVAAELHVVRPAEDVGWGDPGVHGWHDEAAALAIRFHNVANDCLGHRDHPDPALRADVRGDRRCPGGGGSSRSAGQTPARLPDPEPRPPGRARGADRGALALYAPAIPGRGAADPPLATSLGGRPRSPGGPREPDPGPPRTGLDRPRGGARPGITRPGRARAG